MSALRKLYYTLPPNLRFTARRLYFLPVDTWEKLSGKRAPMVPPKGMIFTGSGDFLKQGKKLLQYFIEDAGLQPNGKVLDIGSGIGRIAIPLTNYLDSAGAYEGFDVVELGVKWCQKKISSRFPNFKFTHIDLGNDLYKAGENNAAQFQFPYPADHFDLVILSSVFTHMLPEEVENYLHQISRVLKPGGQCFATFFIYNEEVDQIDTPNLAFQFPYDYGHYRLMDQQVKSANVAYQEEYLMSVVEDAGLTINKAYYGYWPGRSKADCKDFQDILLLQAPTKNG